MWLRNLAGWAFVLSIPCRIVEEYTKIMDIIAKELIELGFKYVTLDLEGYRSGSMLLTLETAHTSQKAP